MILIRAIPFCQVCKQGIRREGNAISGIGGWKCGRYKPTPSSPRRPLRGLHGLGGRVLETAPGGLDLDVGDTMTSRPCLGGGRRVLGDVKPDDGAGSAMN